MHRAGAQPPARRAQRDPAHGAARRTRRSTCTRRCSPTRSRTTRSTRSSRASCARARARSPPTRTTLVSPGRRHREPARPHRRGRAAAGQGHAVHVRSACWRTTPAARALRRRQLRVPLPRALQLSPHPHAAATAVLRATRYVPGTLFSVNAATARTVPDLFARNERVVCDFDTELRAARAWCWSARCSSAASRPCSPARSTRRRVAAARSARIATGVGRDVRARRGDSAASTWARP